MHMNLACFRQNNRMRTAGMLFFLAGFVALMGIITAEIYYPAGYSTRGNEISDLGATRPPDSVVTQPSATIFNTTMMVTGLMILAGVAFLYMHTKDLLVSAPFALFGIGVLGVGVFPGNVTPWHSLFAITTFVFGGIAGVTSSRIVRGPLRYVFIAFGVIALVCLFFSDALIPHLGDGGTEHWVAYPVLFWLTGLGSYMLGVKENGAINQA